MSLKGQNAATHFLLKHGVPKNKIDVVWGSIGFHTSRGIFDRLPTEIALVRLSVLTDAIGAGIEKLATSMCKNFETWPSHGFRYAFPQLVADVIGLKPETAAGSSEADVLRDRGISGPNICEATALAPFERLIEKRLK